MQKKNPVKVDYVDESKTEAADAAALKRPLPVKARHLFAKVNRLKPLKSAISQVMMALAL
ncbi:hypothetical protein [Phytobacter sp. V91]|uniref:hypothetical protein n=1 Tax=Phytobacter sp. V91 TaxID=3369425 RepID=UPI003F5F64DE